MTYLERFATLMKQHRDDRPVVNIAKRVGCNRRTIENMEAGRSLPSLPFYVRLCRAYGLTAAQRAELDEIAAGVPAKDDDAGDAS